MILKFFLDVKAEVENVIKMGRKLVESGEIADDSQKGMLTSKIDSLKEEFNVTGKNVSEVQSNLESSLKMMQKFEAVSVSLENWLGSTSYQLSLIENDSTNIAKLSNFVGETYLDMVKHKRSYLDLYKIYEDISALSNSEHSVKDLETHIESLETQWKQIENQIKHQYFKLSPGVPLESNDTTDISTQLKTRYVVYVSVFIAS